MLLLRKCVKYLLTLKSDKFTLQITSHTHYLHTASNTNIPDYYGILSVPRNASQAEIKESFLELSKLYHPDLNIDNTKKATQKFLEIKDAYNHLSNPTSRLAYNSRLDNIFTSPGFQRDPFIHTPDSQYPPPEGVPRFIKWFDNAFPTIDRKQKQSELNIRHLKVILFMTGIAFLWYGIQMWKIRSLENRVTVSRKRETEKNLAHLEKVKERARSRSHTEHLAELKVITELRNAKHSEE